jgi:hypothetical protein
MLGKYFAGLQLLSVCVCVCEYFKSAICNLMMYSAMI